MLGQFKSSLVWAIAACLCAGCSSGAGTLDANVPDVTSPLMQLPTPRGASSSYSDLLWAGQLYVDGSGGKVNWTVDIDPKPDSLAYANFEIGLGNEIPHLIKVQKSGGGEGCSVFIADFDRERWQLVEDWDFSNGVVLDYLDWSPYISDKDSVIICVAAAQNERVNVIGFRCSSASQLARNVIEQVAGSTMLEGAKGWGYEYQDPEDIVTLPQSMDCYENLLTVRDFLEDYLPARGVYLLVPSVRPDHYIASCSFPTPTGGYSVHTYDSQSGWEITSLSNHPLEYYARKQLLCIWRAERDYELWNGGYAGLADLTGATPPYLDPRFTAGDLGYSVITAVIDNGDDYRALCYGPGFSLEIGPSGFIGNHTD